MNSLPAVGVIHGSLACDFGNKKHKGFFNFRSTEDMDYMMVLDAISRHIACLVDGEDNAKDSNVHHLGHVIADAAIALDCLERGTLLDNRPKLKGCASDVLDREAVIHGEVKKFNYEELLRGNISPPVKDIPLFYAEKKDDKRRHGYPVNEPPPGEFETAEKARLWDKLQTEKDRSN